MKKTPFIAGLLFAALSVSAQQDVAEKTLDNQGASFWERQKAFNEYWKTHDRNQKGKGYKAFSRWEYMMRNRVDASGFIPNPMAALDEWKKAQAQFKVSKEGKQISSTQATAQWQYIGPPNGVPVNGAAGRLCFITFDPVTPSTIWVGSPGGGLWKSTNSGANWTVVNDQLPNLGAAHLAVDPTNTNVMYLSTGDRDAGDNYSIGLLKSTDGGLTWNTTGLSYNVTQMRNVNCVLIDYTNTQILYAATSQGIYKSVDGGVNWLNVKSGGYKDLKFKPGDNNTIYACGNGFTRTTNAGATWSTVSLPNPNSNSIGRVAMAVTPADPTAVYVLGGQGASASYGFAGFYKSTNSGVSFTKTCSSPNLLGWADDGSDAGGQAWYDLAVAVDPTDPNEVICGGVNTWKSTDGGASFSLNTHWWGNGAPYVHADTHVIEYFPGIAGNVLIGCDGGLYSTTDDGISWGMISNGLQIGQQYRLGVSQTNVNLTLTGWQDNGTSLTNQGTAVSNFILGGDGMECAIDPTNATIMYGAIQYGLVFRSTNSGNNFSQIASDNGVGVDEQGDWITPYSVDPNTPTTIYIAKSQVYKSTNSGGSFTTLTSLSANSNKFISVVVAPSNSNYVYASKNNEIWRTINGSTFTQVTLPNGNLTYLCVDPQNEQHIWATIGGYTAGVKVFYSSNAGQTWTNISGNLPNLPANCITYGAGTNDGLYVGTDIGVYYKDNTLPSWVFYSNGLPNVIIDELEFQQSSNKLRAATYGRGLWEVDAYTAPTSAPVAAFTSNKTNVCYGFSVDFYDNSANLPSSWNWTFAGGNPATSTNQSPTITYSAPGTYPVKLVVTNNMGADSSEILSYINVLPAPVVTMSSDTTICKGDSAKLCAFGGTQYVWTPINGLPNFYRQCPAAAPAVTRTYSATVNDINGCQGIGTVKVTVIAPPSNPTVFQVLDTLCANPANGVSYQWYYNGSLLPNDTNRCVHITQNGSYSVTIVDTSLCQYTKTSAGFNVVNIGVNTWSKASGIEMYPNPAQSLINMKFANEGLYTVKIFSAIGALVHSQLVESGPNSTAAIKLSLVPGVYIVDISENGKKSVYNHKLIIVE